MAKASKRRFKKASSRDIRRLQVLTRVAERPGEFKKGPLAQMIADEQENVFHPKTYSRTCDDLLAEGYLVEKDGSLHLGDVVCPPTRISRRDIPLLLQHVQEAIVTSPHREALRSVNHKLRAAVLPVSLVDGLPKTRNCCLFKGRVPMETGEGDILVGQLHDAAVEERKVVLLYLPKGETNPQTITVNPLGVAYSWFTDAWYLVAEDDDQIFYYRMDRIRKCAITDDPFTYPPEFDLHSHLKTPLGVDGSEPVTIKVKFFNIANVLEKVRFETAERCDNGASLVLTHDGAVYTDQVAGINEAAAWLRQYGSSAEVLEPLELRQRMIDTARGLVELYSSAEQTGEEVS